MASAEEQKEPLQISFSADDRDWSNGWKLYYWQFGGGRGQYVRVMFEFCGVEWTEALKHIKFSYDGDWSQNESVKAQIAALNAIKQSGANRTAFAPPMVTHNDTFVLAQMPAIILLLADLFPQLKPANVLEMARARQMLFQVVDVIEEATTASHPIKVHGSYASQKEAADAALTEFVVKGGRLSRHIELFTAELGRNNGGKGWFYGDKVSFVDICVATFMRAFEESMKCLNNDAYTATEEYALLRAHRERFEAMETYQTFAKSDRMPIKDTTPSFMT